MIQMTFLAEDTHILATRNAENWFLVVTDLPTNVSGVANASDEEFGAAVGLLGGGDELPGADVLYPPAEALMERLAESATYPEGYLAAYTDTRADKLKESAGRLLRFIP